MGTQDGCIDVEDVMCTGRDVNITGSVLCVEKGIRLEKQGKEIV